MANSKTSRLGVTVSREMVIALEVRSQKTGLALATQAMVILKTALEPTIASDAVQIRLRQERPFQTRDAWLQDVTTETLVENAVRVDEEKHADDPPA